MKCRLCNTGEAIENSHILPKFATNYLKKTGTGYIRRPEEPNLRSQDSTKIPLLCPDCEARFGKHETYFANKVFHKVNDGTFETIESDRSIYLFAVSLLWRGAIVYLDHPFSQKEPYRDELLIAEQEWRRFLLDEAVKLKHKEFYVVIWHQAPPVVRGLNSYLFRSLDSTLAFIGDDRAFLYSKMGRIMILSNIVGKAGYYKNSKIDPSGGTISRNQEIEGILFAYMEHRASEMIELMSDQSEENLRKQIDWIDKNPQKYWGTEQHRVEKMDSNHDAK